MSDVTLILKGPGRVVGQFGEVIGMLEQDWVLGPGRRSDVFAAPGVSLK